MKITIKTKNNNIIEYVTEQELSTVEMPYMCVGYRFNGSSLASIEDLEKFWNVIDTILEINSLNKEEYYTLVSME